MGKLVIFSPVTGRVLLNGEPVAGAKVEREYHWGWNDEVGRDATKTAADGSFSLPLVERTSVLGSLLPHEPVINQTIVIRHDGKVSTAWAHFKHDYALNGELQGKPVALTCRLEAEPERRGDVFGIGEIE